MDNQQRRLEERLNWLGGIIDGEGMVTVKHRITGSNWVPCISVVNTDLTIIDEVVSILKTVELPHYVQSKTYTNASGTTGVKFEIMFQGLKRCLKALPILIPYLIGKRKRAETLLSWCQYRIIRAAGKYDERDIELIESIRQTPLKRSETVRAARELRLRLKVMRQSDLHGNMQSAVEIAAPAS